VEPEATASYPKPGAGETELNSTSHSSGASENA